MGALRAHVCGPRPHRTDELGHNKGKGNRTMEQKNFKREIVRQVSYGNAVLDRNWLAKRVSELQEPRFVTERVSLNKALQSIEPTLLQPWEGVI